MCGCLRYNLSIESDNTALSNHVDNEDISSIFLRNISKQILHHILSKSKILHCGPQDFFSPKWCEHQVWSMLYLLCYGRVRKAENLCVERDFCLCLSCTCTRECICIFILNFSITCNWLVSFTIRLLYLHVKIRQFPSNVRRGWVSWSVLMFLKRKRKLFAFAENRTKFLRLTSPFPC